MPSYEAGRIPGREDIFDILADDGYTADERKEWLKGLLTRLASDDVKDPEQRQIVVEIRETLRQQASGKPATDDTL